MVGLETAGTRIKRLVGVEPPGIRSKRLVVVEPPDAAGRGKTARHKK